MEVGGETEWAVWADKMVGAKTLRQTGDCEELKMPSTDKTQKTSRGQAQDEAGEVLSHVKDIDLYSVGSNSQVMCTGKDRSM